MTKGVVSVAAALLVAGQPAGAAWATGPSAWWSYSHLMNRLGGTRVRVAGVAYRVDRSLVVCSGVGRARVARGIRSWPRFVCTQSITRDGTLQDVTFVVRVLDRVRFRIVAPRLGP